MDTFEGLRYYISNLKENLVSDDLFDKVRYLHKNGEWGRYCGEENLYQAYFQAEMICIEHGIEYEGEYDYSVNFLTVEEMEL